MLRMRNRVDGQSFSRASLTIACLSLGVASGITCTDSESNTSLNTDGPPMIRQILMNERVVIDGTERAATAALAFGTHPNSRFDNDDGEVTNASTLGTQEIRIILDEHVKGNSLEEIKCADGSFSRVPDGVTPDDIADCSGPLDAIKNRCTAVCLDPEGTPIGIFDPEGDGNIADGVPDEVRMIDYDPDPDVIELGVRIECDGVSVPLSQEFSFWDPSGNQTFPSNPALDYRGLGPEIVLKPLANIGLRTGSDCTISFRPEVVDHDGNQVCAPEGGDITKPCTPGDTSLVQFGTQAFKVGATSPEDGATGVKPGKDSQTIVVIFNSAVGADSLAAITLTEDGAPVEIAPEVSDTAPTNVSIRLDSPYKFETTYVLTVGADVADPLGGTLGADHVVTWTTGAEPPPPDADITPDADPNAPDADTTDAGPMPDAMDPPQPAP